jgi:hypothetical protein
MQVPNSTWAQPVVILHEDATPEFRDELLKELAGANINIITRQGVTFPIMSFCNNTSAMLKSQIFSHCQFVHNDLWPPLVLQLVLLCCLFPPIRASRKSLLFGRLG